jgi:hypothetical protein
VVSVVFNGEKFLEENIKSFLIKLMIMRLILLWMGVQRIELLILSKNMNVMLIIQVALRYKLNCSCCLQHYEPSNGGMLCSSTG